MTDISVDATSTPPAREIARGGALYRLVWKWHFLASLYVLPFLFMLSLTGGVYLYKPQIEAWLYADRTSVSVPANAGALTLEAQVAALDEAVRGLSRVRSIAIAGTPEASTVVEYDDADRTRSIAWIDPYMGEVLGVVERDAMPLQLVRKFHGELLLGDVGTKFVELAAHWAIVMFVTGVVLWWPRGERTLRKAVSPPRGSPRSGAMRKRSWWRETHLFTGMLATVLVVPIIVTGLPWTDVWGGGLDRVQQATGQSSQSLRFGGGAPKSTADKGTTAPYADVVATARAQGLAWPIEMRPPRKPEDAFWIRSASTNRSEQTELVIDRYTGDVLARVDFADNPPVARAVSWGISFHQGEAYGWANLAQNTLAALLGAVLSVSGFMAWWMRRPKGLLGVPTAPEGMRVGWGIAALTLALMILFPLMGLSLVVALVLDRLVFRRLGWFRTERPTAA